MMTFDTLPPLPKAGDVWHVKMPEQTDLATVEVMQSTVMTVQVRNVSDPIGTQRPVRYEHGVIKFVEKCK